MSPHGIKGISKKAKGVSITLNGPKMSKKKRKLVNENSDPEVLDMSAKYWHGLKIDASDDIKEKIFKHLSAPSRRYKLKDDDLVLPAKKKRKLLKNGSLETDSEEEKNSKKGRLQMKKKPYGESPSSKRKRKKYNHDSELAAMSGTKNKSKKSLSGDSCGKVKKGVRQKLSANYEDTDGVCVYDLDTPELKNRARKKKLMSERSKGANHLLNKKKVRIGSGVLTAKNLAKKQKATVRIDGANFKLLPQKERKKLQKKYSVQMVSDGEASDSDNMPENISGSACKKNRTKIIKAKWADLNKKKAKFKKQFQDLEIPKSKKLKRQQMSEEEDDSEDDDYSSEEEDVSDEYVLDEEDDDIEDYEDDDDDDDDDDDEEEEDDDVSSDDQTSDEKSGHVVGLSNGDWEKVNEEQIREVNQDAAYGNGWKTHEGEKPSSSNQLHSWSQNNGISANNTYHHDPLVSQQQQQQQHHQPHQLMQAGNMAAGCMPAQTMSRPMTNTPKMLPPFVTAAETVCIQPHYQTKLQDNSTQVLQRFGDQQHSSYNLYSGGVDYTSQGPTPTYNNDGKPAAGQSQNFHLQHHLLQSQTHNYSGFNHLQSQPNNSSNVQKVKHYYPACIGKEGILEVEGALRPVPPEEVLAQGFRISIKRCDMATLVGSNWLNDEIINFYMNLIVQRGKTEGFNSVYIPSTFFFPMVLKRGYSGVRRWTKNVDIFDHDLMLIPIHLEMENHWTLIAVDFLQCSICYYDSYLQDKDDAMDAILDYLKEEMKAKKNMELDVNSWVKVNMKNIPLQENLSDCGVFSCIYAEYISRGAQMDFTQEDMPYFRRKMVYEIIHQNILDHTPRDTENLISDDLIQETCPPPNDFSNLSEPPVALQNGLPANSLSPTSNENSMKVGGEKAGLTVNSKDLEEEEEISKDSDALQSSSDIDGEQKSTGSADEDLKKRYSTRIVAEMKRIANVFDVADEKEQEILLSQLRHLLKMHSRTTRQKNKLGKVGRRSFKGLLLSGKGESETEESEEVSSTCNTTSSSSSSSSGSMSTVGESSEEETRSSDEGNLSSNSSDNLDQLKLVRMVWEVENLLASLAGIVRNISQASNLMSTRKRLLDPSGSISVIKGIEFISSELQNISNHYNQLSINQSPQKTAVKKHPIPPPPNYVKEREGKILRCIASQLSARHKFQKRKMPKRLLTQKAKVRTKANFIPKKVAVSGDEENFYEVADRKLLARLVKDAGGRVLEGRPCARLQKSLLTKFPLPDGIFDLTCPTPEKSHKQRMHTNLRSCPGKREKKKK